MCPVPIFNRSKQRLRVKNGDLWTIRRPVDFCFVVAKRNQGWRSPLVECGGRDATLL